MNYTKLVEVAHSEIASYGCVDSANSQMMVEAIESLQRRIAELEAARLQSDTLIDNLLRKNLELEAQPAQSVPAGYAECRQCDKCGHAGINDSTEGGAACHFCDWSGESPDEDECPGCGSCNCMGASCPKCGDLYRLVAETSLTAAPKPEATNTEPRFVSCAPDMSTCTLYVVDEQFLFDGHQASINTAQDVLETIRHEFNSRGLLNTVADRDDLIMRVREILAAAPDEGK